MVQRTVLETGGSPSALRGTKNCGDKEQIGWWANAVWMPTVAHEGQLSIMEEQLPQGGKMWGEKREEKKQNKQTGEKQTRQQLLLQACSKGE